MPVRWPSCDSLLLATNCKLRFVGCGRGAPASSRKLRFVGLARPRCGGASFRAKGIHVASKQARTEANKRLSKTERRAQLLAVARDIVRESGSDALTLASLAERAGVTRPIAYEHFETRAGLLVAL